MQDSDRDTVGHQGSSTRFSKHREYTKMLSDCKSGSAHIPYSLLLSFNANNTAWNGSDDAFFPKNPIEQRNGRKRASSMCPQKGLRIQCQKEKPIVTRKRQRISCGNHTEDKSFPLYNPLPQQHQTPIIQSSSVSSIVSLCSASASSLSAYQQQDHDAIHKQQNEQYSHSTNRCNKAKTETERFLVEAIREQFLPMLKESRLSPNVDVIRSLRSNDVAPAHPDVLGVGTFSQVTRVVLKGSSHGTANKNHKRYYACKQLKQELLSNVEDFIKAAAELAYEAFVLSCFDHRNIIKLRGMSEDGIDSFGNAANEKAHDRYTPPASSFFLIMDVLQETLDQRIERWKTISRPKSLVETHQRSIEKISYCQQLASVLEYIHSKGVVYRDLKPQNIGFCEHEKGTLKLFDFGLSRELPQSIPQVCGDNEAAPKNNPNEHILFELSGMVGTIRYMAPEVCLSQPYNRDCDIYSWSIVAWEIWSQTKPFETFTPDLYKSLVCKQGYRPTDESTGTVLPCEIDGLLKQAWKTEPHQRMRWPEIRNKLTGFQKSQELRLRESIRDAAAASMVVPPIPLFHSPVQGLQQGIMDVAVHSPWRMNGNAIGSVGLGEHHLAKSFGQIIPQESSSVPQMPFLLPGGCIPSVSGSRLWGDALDPRTPLLGDLRLSPRGAA